MLTLNICVYCTSYNAVKLFIKTLRKTTDRYTKQSTLANWIPTAFCRVNKSYVYSALPLIYLESSARDWSNILLDNPSNPERIPLEYCTTFPVDTDLQTTLPSYKLQERFKSW